MSHRRFVHRSRLEFPAADVFAWHARPGALERLSPPWERVRRIEGGGPLAEDSRTVLEVGVGPFTTRWVARHFDIEPGRRFRDEQEKGPFHRWVHEHRVDPVGDSECELVDEINYALPLGALGDALARASTVRRLERVFRYRHARVAADLRRIGDCTGLKGMRIAVTGSSGLIGSALVPFLSTAGATVIRLVRRAPKPGERRWDPIGGILDPTALEGADAVVHLAGENIAAHRWNPALKDRIQRSRIDGTRLLAETIAKLRRPPRVLACASGVGLYGNRGDEVLDELSAPGLGFLAETCDASEVAAESALRRGVRVAHLRFGTVLSAAGGALPRLARPFRLGLGGHIGSGMQWWSWISMDDAVAAIQAVLCSASMHGPVNVVAPHPLPNEEFTRLMGRVLHRPTAVRMPAFAARAAVGEIADETLLASQRAMPRQLEAIGFRFEHPTLEAALRWSLGTKLPEPVRRVLRPTMVGSGAR